MNMFRAFMELDKLNEATFDKPHRWSFTGKARYLDSQDKEHIISINKEIEINGKSEAQALNNAKYKIRQDNKLPINTKLDLIDPQLVDLTEIEEAEAEAQELKRIEQEHTCPECDRRLNDGGTCPVCDDGEEDYD